MGSQQVFAQAHERLSAKLQQWGLPTEVVSAIVQRHTIVRYPKGAPLFMEGAPADVAFVVLGGVVKIYCPSSRGRILLGLAGSGDLVGYADYVDMRGQCSQLFEAEALTNTVVALFTRQHVMKVLGTLSAGALVLLIESVNSFWAQKIKHYALFPEMTLRERLEFVLQDLGTHFGVKEARGLMLTVPLAQAELAEMIGGSRPMVSKMLAEMVEAGSLTRQGRNYILPHIETSDAAPRSAA